MFYAYEEAERLQEPEGVDDSKETLYSRQDRSDDTHRDFQTKTVAIYTKLHKVKTSKIIAAREEEDMNLCP